MTDLIKEFRELSKRDCWNAWNEINKVFEDLPKLLDYIQDLEQNYHDAKRFWQKMHRYKKALEKCQEQRDYALLQITNANFASVKKFSDELEIEKILKGEG